MNEVEVPEGIGEIWGLVSSIQRQWWKRRKFWQDGKGGMLQGKSIIKKRGPTRWTTDVVYVIR